MTGVSAMLFGVFGVFAVADWVVVARGERSMEYVAKPATLVALIAAAATLDAAESTRHAWFLVALLFSLGGDVFLMLPRDLFVAGLASFLVGHVAYVVGFVVDDGSLLAAPVVIALASPLALRIIRGARVHDPRLQAPVGLYIGVISLMVGAAIGDANGWAIGGALLFYASDAMIGWSRFVKGFPHARVAIIVTYHLGQAGLILSLI